MTIRKGAAWGRPGKLPSDGVVVSSDAAARAAVEPPRRAGEPLPVLGLVGGDLCRTLGGPGESKRLRSPDAMRFPVDLGSVLACQYLPDRCAAVAHGKKAVTLSCDDVGLGGRFHDPSPKRTCR